MSLNRICVLFGCLLLLGACGFQLRGNINEILSEISLAGSASTSKSEAILEEIFLNSGNSVKKTNSDGLTISLLEERSSRRSVLTTRSMSVAEYELRIELDLFILLGQRIILPETTISSTRVFAASTENQSASYEEQLLLQREMREEIALKVLRLAEYNLDRAELPK